MTGFELLQVSVNLLAILVSLPLVYRVLTNEQQEFWLVVLDPDGEPIVDAWLVNGVPGEDRTDRGGRVRLPSGSRHFEPDLREAGSATRIGLKDMQWRGVTLYAVAT